MVHENRRSSHLYIPGRLGGRPLPHRQPDGSGGNHPGYSGRDLCYYKLYRLLSAVSAYRAQYTERMNPGRLSNKEDRLVGGASVRPAD